MHSSAAVTVSEIASLTAILAGIGSMLAVSLPRRQARKVVEARLVGLGESVVEISSKSHHTGPWGTAGLTAGSVVLRVVSRTPTGEKRVRAWAYDPAAPGGLKSYA